jgi:hypothetical protein
MSNFLYTAEGAQGQYICQSGSGQITVTMLPPTWLEAKAQTSSEPFTAPSIPLSTLDLFNWREMSAISSYQADLNNWQFECEPSSSSVADKQAAIAACKAAYQSLNADTQLIVLRNCRSKRENFLGDGK